MIVAMILFSLGEKISATLYGQNEYWPLNFNDMPSGNDKYDDSDSDDCVIVVILIGMMRCPFSLLMCYYLFPTSIHFSLSRFLCYHLSSRYDHDVHSSIHQQYACHC